MNPITLKYADPYAPLLDAFASGNIVIFDVESTGLDTVSDEVVELAAAKVNHKGRQDEFHAYLKNEKPVGESFSVHKLSDHFLAQKGKDPKKVLEEFGSFCEGCVLVGHNVAFDKNIIESQGLRIGAKNPTVGLCFDTGHYRFGGGSDPLLAYRQGPKLPISVLSDGDLERHSSTRW